MYNSKIDIGKYGLQFAYPVQKIFA